MRVEVVPLLLSTVGHLTVPIPAAAVHVIQ